MSNDREYFHLWPALEEMYGNSAACRDGDTIYMSGIPPYDKNGDIVGIGNAGAQAGQIFKNAKKILDHFGATIASVVDMTIYMAGVDEQGMQDIIIASHEAIEGRTRPAIMGIQVASLAVPELMVEIKMTARI